jgi:cytidine deaminase
LIAAYSPKDRRRKDLALRIADSLKEFPPTPSHENLADQLIERDEKDRARRYGQNVRDTFALGDFFVDVSKSREEIEQEITRFIEILFGHPFHTPYRDEVGMFFARAAALRSAEMGRQVGAAITTAEGELIAVGANEVPKAGGGQYSAPEVEGEVDHRDFTRGQDTSDVMKRSNLREVIEVFKNLGWLAPGIAESDAITLLEQAQPAMSQTRIMNAIEFGRAVHAEMAAITEAARRGTPIASTTLYTTTFPCHNCARHVVSAGIARVVYIEPYAKSLASQFHDDSIAVERVSDGTKCHKLVSFEPFVGIAPLRYMELFSMTRRKGPDGRKYDWDGAAGDLRLVPPHTTYFDLEISTTQGLILERPPVV